MPTRLAIPLVLFAAMFATCIGTASASPVAVNDETYSALGRVFPDPLAGCAAKDPESGPCSPSAKGTIPATQFIQWEEFLAGIEYLNKEHPGYMEVWTLDGKLDAQPNRQLNGSPADLLGAQAPVAGTDADVRPRSGTGLGADAFPGNSLNFLEFTPRPEYRSAGLPTPFLDRKKSDLIVVRVTDESVPDVGKKRYALSLSIHGIERAGLEGGTRAIEDLVSAGETGAAAAAPLVPTKANAPSFEDALDESIIYFTYPNPDGWRRGSYSEGGLFFQRYNGNGVDINRDWPDIGFSFRPYSGLSEPESRALSSFFTEVRDNYGPFAAGDDLHGQGPADALSYTLMPHGSHDYAKDTRIRETTKTIHTASYEALKWSPLILAPDDPQPSPNCVPAVVFSQACRAIYGQTWGTVYDTINYTTTGALGDWFDSSVGLNADGIDNEMSFSHLDKNIVFEPQTEQLHVDGNKSLIFAHLAEILRPTEIPFEAQGTKGYVPNERLVREASSTQPEPPAGTSPQQDIEDQPCVPDPTSGGMVTCPFTVESDADTYSGGMRIDITQPNVNGVSSGIASLKIQCKGCDQHRGTTYTNAAHTNTGWVTVQEDFNQSNIYAQAGVTAAVNHPQAKKSDGTPVEWRALIDTQSTFGVGFSAQASTTPAVRMSIDFTSGPAAIDGGTANPDELPPTLAAYDVASTDFFADLNKYISGKRDKFHVVDPAKVIAGQQALADFDTIALADDALPGTYAAAERAEWFAKLRKWVEDGGNLVLTDGALKALPELTNIPANQVLVQSSYVGQVGFTSQSATVLDADSLTKDVAQPGARFNTSNRRQTYEPTPLGYPIQTPSNADLSSARVYSVATQAWTDAGGRHSANSGTNGRTALGELALGAGQIRIAGALLPQPATWKDGLTTPDAILRTYPLGLEPYAVTYTGYILARNLLDDSTPADHNIAPIAALSHSPDTVLTGETVDFDASASSDPDGTIENYSWDLDGDGTFETDTGKSPTTAHAYTENGTYLVAVKVTDDEDKSGIAVDTVTVENRLPTATFTWSPTTAKKKKPVTFDASGSSDSDGTIARYLWDFDGNGTVDREVTSPTVSHSFATTGNFSVTLTVVDDDGGRDSETRTVTVTAAGR